MARRAVPNALWMTGVAFGPRSAEVDGLSRRRRPFLSDRYIFVTVKVLKPRRHLGEGDFKPLASAMSRMRQKHRFLLTAWVFLPDHGRAIVYPRDPLTISELMKAVKVSSTISINRGRQLLDKRRSERPVELPLS